MHLRPTQLQTTNTRSNAYWLQHDVQHYRMKYAVKKIQIHIRNGVQRNLHLKWILIRKYPFYEIFQIKTKGMIIQQFKLPSCNIKFNRYFYFITLLSANTFQTPFN